MIYIYSNQELFAFNHICDEDEFIGIIKNAQLDKSMLDKLLFVPLDKNDADDESFSEIDPDTIYFTEYQQVVNGKCKYHSDISFKKSEENLLSMSFTDNHGHK